MIKMNYEQVPDIISNKDLDYLEDMFNYNYLGYKKIVNYIDMVNNLEIEEIMEKAGNTFNDNMQEILAILKQGGNNG